MVSETKSWQLSDDEVDRRQRLSLRFAEARPIVERRTSNPTAVIWNELERFAGGDAARRALAKRSGRTKPNKWQVDHICQSIRLASAYFASYRASDSMISPPQLYYGAMHLAEAVAFLDVQRDLPQKHGTAASHLTGKLREASIKFDGYGTQQVLSAVLGGDQLGVGSASVTIPVYNLLRAIPDLDQIMTELTGEGTSLIPVTRSIEVDPNVRRVAQIGARIIGGEAIGPRVYVAMDLNTRTDEDITDGDTMEDQLAIYPAIMDRNGISDNSGNLNWRAHGSCDDDFRTLTISTPYGYFFERRLPSGAYLPEMAIILALLHFTSMLSRYRAVEWIRLLDERSDDFSILREFLAVSERKVAHLALNELTQCIYDIQLV